MTFSNDGGVAPAGAMPPHTRTVTCFQEPTLTSTETRHSSHSSIVVIVRQAWAKVENVYTQHTSTPSINTAHFWSARQRVRDMDAPFQSVLGVWPCVRVKKMAVPSREAVGQHAAQYCV